jgi:ribosomal protein S18 acetylase RimI-like enzyme
MTDVIPTARPIHLRATRPDDLDFVLALEHRPENRDFIGQWPREEHLATLSRVDREHLMIAAAGGAPLGYVITYDVRRDGYGVYIKRIAVREPAQGTGRAALVALAARAWDQGYSSICLAVRTGNERAQRCYRAVGFDVWTPDAAGWADFMAKVDPLVSGCLLMRLARPGTSPP